jgi:lipopolysaccharide export system permease protein
MLKFLEAENVLRFDLVDGEIHELPVPKDLSTYRRTKFEKYTINIKDVDRSLQRTERKHRGDRELSVADMKEKITGLYADIDLADVRITKAAEARMKATFDLLDAGRRAEIFGTAAAKNDSAETTPAVLGQGNRRLTKAALRVRDSRGGRRNLPLQGRNEFVTRQEIETQINTKTSFIRQINRYRVEIHKKYSIPFACIIFVLVGTPLAMRTGRSGMNTAIGLSILFFLVYYVCLIGGEKLADRGIISPVAAMWAPNLFFGIMAVVLLRGAAKEQSVGDWRFSNLLKVFIRRDVSTNTR